MVATLSSTQSYGKVFNPQSFTLKNGLQVILVENHLAPVVSIALTYKIGTADDPSDMVGLSHFLEHLMFKGTKEVPNGEFTQRIISKGGNINAHTTPDYTCYTCDISVEHLEMILKMEADRMSNIIFNENETKAEQKVVMEERKMRLDNNPLGPAHETVQRALHKYHPYGIPPIGYPQHILAYTNEAIEQHYKKWYTPNNAVLLISGDITLNELKPLVEKYFAPIPSRPIPARERPQDPDDSGIEQFIKIENPRVSYVGVDWYFRTPKYTTKNLTQMYAISILAQILGGNATSRLYKDLVDTRHLALDANVHQGISIDPEHLEISATLHPEHKIENLKKAVEEHLTNIATHGITDEELVRAKRDLLADLAYARDGNSGAIEAFRSIAFGFSIDEIEAYPDRINAITKDQVNQVAKTYLGRRPSVVTETYPDGYKGPNHTESNPRESTHLRPSAHSDIHATIGS